MKFEFVYIKTVKIKKYLRRLSILAEVIEMLPHLPAVEESLRRQSYLKSSVYSAQIEGNRLDIKSVAYGGRSKDREKLEIFNILSCLHWLYSARGPKKLSVGLVDRLSKKTMKGLGGGGFRREAWAVFDAHGNAIYLAPPASEVRGLTGELIEKASKIKNVAIRAALTHFWFEKIHPLADGNGRVGRLLSTFILKSGGFGFRGLVSLEEYLEVERETYYDLLNKPGRSLTIWVEFFLCGLVVQAEKAIEALKTVDGEEEELRLLPRRKEILEIVRDQRMVSFDFLRRRFDQVSEATIHYDLSCLRRDGLIKKIGSTRGVLYGVGGSKQGYDLVSREKVRKMVKRLVGRMGS